MSNIYFWEKLTFSKHVGKVISEKENSKKCTSFEELKRRSYICWKVYFGIIVFSCLSSTKLCVRFFFFFICFTQEIKGFYQSSLRKEVDFRDIMNVSLRSKLNNKILKNWDSFIDERALMTTAMISSCHWKTLVPYCLRKTRPENAFLTLAVNYRKIVQKNKLCHSKQQ